MGQESTGSWTAQTLLQAGRFLWPMLLIPDMRRAMSRGHAFLRVAPRSLPLSTASSTPRGQARTGVFP